MRKHFVVVACGIVLLATAPGAAFAEDLNSITMRGSTLYFEYNFMPSGNSRVFSTKDQGSVEHPFQEEVGQDDATYSYLRAGAEYTFTFWKRAEIWFHVHTESDYSRTLRSAGGEFTLLTSLDWFFGLDTVKAGYYHHSAHNFLTQDYGNGIFYDGVHVEWKPKTVSEGADVRFWYTYMFVGDYSPYVFTRQAKTMPRFELATTRSRMGWDIRYGEKYPWRFQLTHDNVAPGPWGDIHGGPAALRTRLDIEWYRLGAAHAGTFVEYNRNLRRTDEFGTDEWQAGIKISFLSDEPR